MFNSNFDPLEELHRLRAESINQRTTINQLIGQNNQLQELLVQLSGQHTDISKHYGKFNKKLSRMDEQLQHLRNNAIVLSNDLESEN